MATPAMVRAYAAMGSPALPYEQPPDVSTGWTEQTADDYANAWAYNMGYTRAVDQAIRQARWGRLVP